MPVDVHAAVQDAHDIDAAFGRRPIKQDVRPRGELPIALADFVTRPTNEWIRRRSFKGALKFAQILIGLTGIPAVIGVVPDPIKIRLRGRREEITAH